MMLWEKLIWRARACARGDEGSMPLALLVILVGLGLSAALAPAAITQKKNTTFVVTRDRALNAAQAGIDVVIGKIRQANDGSGNGDPTQLPCTYDSSKAVLTPITGNVDSGTSSYSVTVDYYVSDPVSHPTAVRMLCVPTQGTYDSTAHSVTPGFAKIVATGYDNSNQVGGTNGRTITSIYALEVDNSNISGGTVRIYPTTTDGAAQFCMDTGSDTPTANVTLVTLQTCSTTFPPAAQQTFAYRNDLTLQLVSSVGTTVSGVTYRNGLCIDDASTTTSGGVSSPASGSSLVLKQCGPLGSPVWSQQWAFDTYAAFHAPNSRSASTGTLSSYCIAVALSGSVHAAGAISLKTCDGTFPTPTNTWIASPSVGAGAATNSSSQQWINFGQFGECIHDPRGDTAAPYLIAGSCLQNPLQSAIGTNQKVVFGNPSPLTIINPVSSTSTTSELYFNYSGTNWCLYSQRPAANDPNVLDHRILLTKCTSHSGVTVSQLQWTRSTPDTDPTKPYSYQYRFQDVDNQCMGLAEISMANDVYGGAYDPWKKLVTATCDLTTFQQWNADNNVGNSALQNTKEN